MRFIVFGDSKGKDNGINKKALKAIMSESSKLMPKPEFIVVCGDSVAGSNKEEILSSQLTDFRSIIHKYHPNKPLIPVVGNHEVNIEPIDDRFEKTFSQIYEDLTPDNSLRGYNKTTYYIDFGETRIIVLNAFHYGALHKISKEQLNWLKEIASENKKNKFVFVHSPAFPTGAHYTHSLDLYPKDRDAFWSIIENCGIDMVFSGHEHNYSRRIISGNMGIKGGLYRRSTYQIITGGGGEKLRDKYLSKEGVIVAPIDTYHFIVVDVENNLIKTSAISSKGKKLDEFIIRKPSY